MPKARGKLHAAREERLEEAEQLLISGERPVEVVKRLAEKYNVGKVNIRNDLKLLERNWRASGTSREKLMLLDGYRKAIKIGKVGNAVQAMKLLHAQSKDVEYEEEAREFAEKLGEPPLTEGVDGGLDPIKGAVWLQKSLLLCANTLKNDGSVKSSDKETRMIRLAKAYNGLMPMGEIFDATERIRRDAEGVDDDYEPEVKRANKQARPMRSEAG